VALEQMMRLLSMRLREDIPRHAERIFESVSIDPATPQAIDYAFSSEVRRRNIVASLESIFTGLGGGRAPPDETPATAVEIARVAVRSGIELQDIVHAYRVGHALTWDLILERASEIATNPEEHLAVLRLSSRFLFAWNDRVVAQLSEVYQRESDRRFQDRQRQKQRLIADLLDGLPVDPTRLRYDLQSAHLALVGWGTDPTELMRQAAADLDAALLMVTGPGDSVFGWLGGHTLRSPHVPGALRRSAQPGTRLAVGRPGEGVDGFRRSHRQAIQAYRVALQSTTPIVLYQDVTIEALVGDERTRLREFVENELGPLLTDGERDSDLRDTLRAYFSTGQNAASAAPLLGIHERTVANRLRTIEARLGYAIRGRTEELVVALRLLSMLEQDEHAPDWRRPSDAST
jgi:hypothetical protein